MKHRPGKAVRRMDLLDYEFSHGRLSQQALDAGRMLEGVWSIGGVSYASWSERVDTSLDPDRAATSKVERAQAAARMNARVQSVVGSDGLRLLKTVLVDGASLADAAAALGEPTAMVGYNFRRDLRLVAENVLAPRK